MSAVVSGVLRTTLALSGCSTAVFGVLSRWRKNLREYSTAIVSRYHVVSLFTYERLPSRVAIGGYSVARVRTNKSWSSLPFVDIQAIDIGFHMMYPLWLLASRDKGGLQWSVPKIGKVGQQQ